MKNEDSKIIIGRKSSVFGCAIKYNVLLDNTFVGALGNGNELILHSFPGSHTLSLLKGKKPDAVITFHIPVGQNETYFFVEPGSFKAKITQLNMESVHTKSGKRHTGRNILIAFGVLLVLGAIGNALPETENAPPESKKQSVEKEPPKQEPQPKADTEQKESPIAISAKELYDAYVANQVNADSLYLDKELMVTGTILDITQDALTNAPCIKLAVGDALGIYAVDCFFPKNTEETSIIAGFVDGQVVTIFGECDGVALVDVQLSKCHL